MDKVMKNAIARIPIMIIAIILGTLMKNRK